jgi:hypothetical protein
MCLMLVVKAIDMLQQLALARDPQAGGGLFTVIGVVIAVLGAVILFALSESQVSQMPNTSSFQGAPDLLSDPQPGGY